MPTTESWTIIISFLPLIVVLITLTGTVFLWLLGQWANRKEAKRAAKLARLNQQLSDLYGPLYALYETGEKQWFTFVGEYSNDPMEVLEFRRFFPIEDRIFDPPALEQLKQYRLWMETTFMPNNVRMEEVIVNHADLIVGHAMPQCLLDLCAHVAANRPLLKRWESKDFDQASIKDHQADYAHPGFALREYVNSSFLVLKKEQEQLLNREKDDINEKDVEGQINDGIDKLRIARELRFAKESTRLLNVGPNNLLGPTDETSNSSLGCQSEKQLKK